jgi:hypothetical protein
LHISWTRTLNEEEIKIIIIYIKNTWGYVRWEGAACGYRWRRTAFERGDYGVTHRSARYSERSVVCLPRRRYVPHMFPDPAGFSIVRNVVVNHTKATGREMFNRTVLSGIGTPYVFRTDRSQKPGVNFM